MNASGTAFLPRRASWPAVAAAIVFLVVYAVELGSFTLSIDEEIASVSTAGPMAWLEQGRWGMALVTAALPDFQAIPVLSTLLFGIGLVYASTRAVEDFRLEGGPALAFAVLFVAFPLWPHIAQFNTLAAGFGIGIAAVSVGAGIAVHAKRYSHRCVSILLIGFGIAVYQTLAVYAIAYILFALHARFANETSFNLRSVFHQSMLAVLSLAAAAALYAVVQRVAAGALDASITYVDIYWQGERLVTELITVVGGGLRDMATYLSGTQSIYLEWGVLFLIPAWLGLIPLWLISDSPAPRTRRLAVFGVVVAGALVVVSLPFILTSGTLPARAHVAIPLVVAWLASRTPWPSASAFRTCGLLFLGYSVIASISVSATLFNFDRVVRDADKALANDMVAAIRSAVPSDAPVPIAFTVAGEWSFPARGQLTGAGVFGISFFGQDQGNIYRIWYFMQTQGVTGLQPVLLGSNTALVQAAENMPSWPAKDSVRLVDGVVVVKLGPATPPQLVSH